MNLWKVRCEGAGVWVAFSSSRNIKRWFSTHAEAVAYADRMARTVEIVLPEEAPTRIPAHAGTRHMSWYTFIPGLCSALTIGGPWGQIGIAEERDIKPLALALLAHYYQQEQE